MPVIDRKPINIDNDDKQHKNLTHRQGINYQNNNTSQNLYVYPYTVNCSSSMKKMGDHATHSTIVGKGNHNHHNRSYKIQVTNTGRIITCNRQHIKPAPITAEEYMWYQASKHTKTHPPNAIHGSHSKRSTYMHMTKLFLMKGMTIKIYMVSMRLETIYKAAKKNRQRKYVLIQGWSMTT